LTSDDGRVKRLTLFEPEFTTMALCGLVVVVVVVVPPRVLVVILVLDP